ncbi:GIY-YIG nuclease family protein [Sulfitobacter sp. R18_1]|nr:GIY-YIG nuclease family protein [Sulfitobacter sp. R18_1]MBO9428494.1 GIY-YIG nuclease family protein [Sulfitobacter sp. R18_1]
MRRNTRKTQRGSSQWGYVYILTNPSFPGLLKIGMTTRTPAVRARELSSATGVPTPFKVIFSSRTRNPKRVEALVHRALYKRRVNRNREFFKMTPEAAKKTIVKFSDCGEKASLKLVFLRRALFGLAVGGFLLIAASCQAVDIEGYIYSILYFLQVVFHV